MTLAERMRYARKNIIKLSQQKLADELEVSRNTIKNIEMGYDRRPELKIPLLKIICRKYGINEEWLIKGDGDPEASEESFTLDSFARRHGATALEFNAMRAYFSVDEETRRMFMEQFYSYLADYEQTRVKEAISKSESPASGSD